MLHYERSKAWNVPYSHSESDGPIGNAMRSCSDDRAQWAPGCKHAGESSYLLRSVGCCDANTMKAGAEVLSRFFKGGEQVDYSKKLAPTRSDKHICGACKLVWCVAAQSRPPAPTPDAPGRCRSHMEELYLTQEKREQAPLDDIEGSLEEVCSSLPPVFTIGVRAASPSWLFPSLGRWSDSLRPTPLAVR